jgi:hypothetical protein
MIRQSLEPLPEDIMFFAFRYALGRRTAAPTMVRTYLSNHWELIPVHTQDQIKGEIQRAIETGRAGDQCDVETWKAVLEW